MSIINSYRKDSKPTITVEKVYPVRSEITLKACIITFSHRIISALIEDNVIEVLSEDSIRSISHNYTIYRFIGTDIGIFKTCVGAPITATLMEEFAYMYSCDKIVVFGTCGGLDKSIPEDSIIVPVSAYRDEGMSYHYMPPSDYIDMPNYVKVCEVLRELNVPFVKGKTWTTDAFYRETEEELAERKSEGCIAVEMEASACQAVANYKNLQLYYFLCRKDNLDSTMWEKGQSDSAMRKDERLKLLFIAYEIAKRV